jgi:hypothetical protein
MSNGHVCCILGVCCPPAERKEALARELRGLLTDWGGELAIGASQYMAAELLAKFDIAPKGTAKAVLDGWGAGAKLRSSAIGDRIVDLYTLSFAQKAFKDSGG